MTAAAHQILTSQIDQSVNIVTDAAIGFFEHRYVRRVDDYFIIYLSAQSGCDQACRMCHLTATGQNQLENATLENLLNQADRVYQHYEGQTPARLVHYNFMARGEPMNSPVILNDSDTLFTRLHAMAAQRGLESKILVSSILPTTLDGRALIDIFPGVKPEIYYSLYSMQPDFRKHWLARALPAQQGLEMLKAWQVATGKIPKIHFAFIEGENDSEADMRAIADAVNALDLKIGMNVVRYNPQSEKYGRESSEAVIQRNAAMLQEWIPLNSFRIVPKVGFDVKASCGMFVDKA